MQWWRQLPAAPSSEDVMLNTTAPFLRSALADRQLESMTEEGFHNVCMGERTTAAIAQKRPADLNDNKTHVCFGSTLCQLCIR
jgi:hypothetical protein